MGDENGEFFENKFPSKPGPPPDVTITIEPREDTKFQVDLQIGDYWETWTINMSRDDVRTLNQTFQKEAEQLIEQWEWKGISSEEYNKRIYQLVITGNSTFTKVFTHVKARQKLQTALKRKRDNPASILIISEVFSLPWEFIYTFDVTRTPHLFENFWGMNHIIRRRIAKSYDGESADDCINSPPKLGLLTDSSLSSVDTKEIPFFERLRDNGLILLDTLDDLDPNNRISELDTKFKAFLGNPLNIVHFACHAVYEEGQNSRITLSKEFDISLNEMESYKVTTNGNPLIILNACESGNLNPLYTMNFVDDFLNRGAIGVVATECVVPDDFAAAFAQKLYDFLLPKPGKESLPLGRSLLETRRHFLDSEKNPSGLIYSMYARPSIKFKQECEAKTLN